MADVGHLLNMKRREDLPDIHPGDTVRVIWQVVEGTRTRGQIFEGVVIRLDNGKDSTSSSMTVRRIFQGVGVERLFPLSSPRLEKVTVQRRGKVRRAKLYYLRDLTGKKARIKEKTDYGRRNKGAAE